MKTKRLLKSNAITVKKTFVCKNLWRHIEEVHGKTKYNTDKTKVSAFPHRCEQCNFKTKRKFDIKRHYMQKHSLCDVTFPCEKVLRGILKLVKNQFQRFKKSMA